MKQTKKRGDMSNAEREGSQTEPHDRPATAQAAFVAWYVENYPPRTIISVPEWHAPKIYRAAIRSVEMEHDELLAALLLCVDVVRAWHGPNAWDIYYWHSPEMRPIREAIERAKAGHPTSTKPESGTNANAQHPK